MARMRFTRRGRSGPRRKYAWGGGRIGGTTIMADGDVGAFWLRAPAGALDTTFSPPILVEPDVTLIRTRALVAYASNNGGSQLTQAHNMGFGLIAWDGLTDNPVDVGLLPHPSIDQSLDWIWRSVDNNVLDNIALSNNAGEVDQYQSQAQRKLSNGTGILFVYGFTAPTGNPASLTVTIAGDFRYLVKLP